MEQQLALWEAINLDENDRYEHIQRPYVTDVEGTPGSQL